jgi:hypothetical protein
MGKGYGVGMSSAEHRAAQSRIMQLRQEHRDMDAAIQALADSGTTDQLQLARLKKRKLFIKDEILSLENSLIPDRIA